LTVLFKERDPDIALDTQVTSYQDKVKKSKQEVRGYKKDGR